jgi:hypothetical protein
MTILCRFGLDRFAFLREARDHAYKDIRGWTKQSLHVLPKKRAKCNHVVVTSPVRNVLDQNLMTDRRLQPRPIVLRSQLLLSWWSWWSFRWILWRRQQHHRGIINNQQRQQRHLSLLFIESTYNTHQLTNYPALQCLRNKRRMRATMISAPCVPPVSVASKTRSPWALLACPM